MKTKFAIMWASVLGGVLVSIAANYDDLTSRSPEASETYGRLLSNAYQTIISQEKQKGTYENISFFQSQANTSQSAYNPRPLTTGGYVVNKKNVRELRLVRFELERYMNGYANRVASAEVAAMHAAFDCRVKNIDSNSTMDKECKRIFETQKQAADAKVDGYIEQKSSQGLSQLEKQPVQESDTPLFNPELQVQPSTNPSFEKNVDVPQEMPEKMPEIQQPSQQQSSDFQPVPVPAQDDPQNFVKEPKVEESPVVVPNIEEKKPIEVEEKKQTEKQITPKTVIEKKDEVIEKQQPKPQTTPELKKPYVKDPDNHQLPTPIESKEEDKKFNPLDYIHPSIRKKAIEEQNSAPSVPAPEDANPATTPVQPNTLPVNKLPAPVPVPEMLPQEPKVKTPDNQEYGIKPTSPFKISRNKWGMIHKNFSPTSEQKLTYASKSQYDMTKTATISEKKTHIPKEITLYFENGTQLKPQSLQVLSEINSEMKYRKDIHIKLSGYADKGKSDIIDKEMSRKRIDYVLSQLKTSNQNIETIAYGNQNSISGLSASDNRNRRVVIQVN